MRKLRKKITSPANTVVSIPPIVFIGVDDPIAGSIDKNSDNEWE